MTTVATTPAAEPPGTPAKRSRGRPAHLVPSEIYQTRRDEILRAAKDIFASKGYGETSLDDVARAINLSKPTLYYYFPSKAHLFYRLAAIRTEEGLTGLAEIAKIADARARLEALIRFQVERVAGDMQFYRYFFDHRPPLHNKRLKAEVKEKLQQYSQYFYDAVRHGIESKVIPPVDEFMATQAIFGATYWMYKWYDPEKYTVDQAVDHFLSLLHLQPAQRA